MARFLCCKNLEEKRIKGTWRTWVGSFFKKFIYFFKELALDGWEVFAAAAAKSPQSCPTLCDPIDGSPPGCPVPGILQARTLEWIAISFSNAWKWKVKVKSLRRVWLLAAPWTAAHQAPPSLGFSRLEYWSGLPLVQKQGRLTGPKELIHIHVIWSLLAIVLITN